MEEALEIVARVSVPVFVVACMAAAGLGIGVRDVVAPFRRARLLIAALGANFVIAPALAYGLAVLLGLDQPYATGLVLLGSAAGAPFLPKLAELARGDVAYSVGLMLLLTVVSAGVLPVVLPLLAPGLAVGPWPILRPLLVTMLVPLAVGMLVRSRSERWAGRLRPLIARVSNVSMVVAVVLLVGLNYRPMLDTLGSGAVFAALLFVATLVVVGYGLGGPSPGTRSVLGLGTGQRNIAAGLIVATGDGEPRVMTMLLVSTLAGLLVLVPAARLFARGRLAGGQRVTTAPHAEVTP